MPSFSIVIPAYKSSYLREAIVSCLSQTYVDFELFIVDDASPEDLASIVYSFKDSRIRYYRNDVNCGPVNVVDNWNKCLEYVQGEFVICLGDDDRLLPCYLSEINSLIEKYPLLDVYHAWTELIDENSNLVTLSSSRPEWESVYSFVWNRMAYRWHQYIGDFCFRSSFLRKNGGFYKLPVAWGSDDITATIAASVSGIANTQIPCFQYRISVKTLTNCGDSVSKMNAVMGEIQWYTDFLRKEPEGSLDKKLYFLINQNLDDFFLSKKRYILKQDIESNGYWVCHRWMKICKQYGLTCKNILRLAYDLFMKRV